MTKTESRPHNTGFTSGGVMSKFDTSFTPKKFINFNMNLRYLKNVQNSPLNSKHTV